MKKRESSPQSILAILERRRSKFTSPIFPVREKDTISLVFLLKFKDTGLVLCFLLCFPLSRPLCGNGISSTFLNDRGIFADNGDATFRGTSDLRKRSRWSSGSRGDWSKRGSGDSSWNDGFACRRLTFWLASQGRREFRGREGLGIAGADCGGDVRMNISAGDGELRGGSSSDGSSVVFEERIRSNGVLG